MAGECGTKTASWHPPERARRGRRSIRTSSTSWRCAMSSGSRRRGPSFAIYLARKIRERGWNGDARARPRGASPTGSPSSAMSTTRPMRSTKARALTGPRLRQAAAGRRSCASAGVEDADGEAARSHADEEAVAAALRFAERRRLGPFAALPRRDPRDREKALAAMIRAGHGFALARAILELAPGAEIDPGRASRTRSDAALTKVGLPTLALMLMGARGKRVGTIGCRGDSGRDGFGRNLLRARAGADHRPREMVRRDARLRLPRQR